MLVLLAIYRFFLSCSYNFKLSVKVFDNCSIDSLMKYFEHWESNGKEMQVIFCLECIKERSLKQSPFDRAFFVWYIRVVSSTICGHMVNTLYVLMSTAMHTWASRSEGQRSSAAVQLTNVCMHFIFLAFIQFSASFSILHSLPEFRSEP